MSSSDRSELWIDYFPRLVGADELGTQLTGHTGLGPYLILMFAVSTDVILSLIAEIHHGQPPLLRNPFWPILPLVLLFCIWSIKKMEDDYQNLIQHHDIKSRIRDDNTVNFDQLISTQFRWGLYAIALILYIGTFIIRGQFSSVINTVGLMIGFIKTGIIIPFVYIPIGVEFAAIYTSIHLDLPRRVRRADLEMDFTDPMNFGGMYYFGELIRNSYYIFIILIISFLFWTYAPRVSDSIIYYPYPETGFETTVQFVIFWAIGTVFLVHSVWIFHTHMTKAKREKVNEINQHLQDLGDDDRSIPETQSELEEILRVQLEHDKSRRVRDMHEYPFDAEMISQLVLSVLLPLALERILNTIF